jgi:FkbM family methyltransferase
LALLKRQGWNPQTIFDVGASDGAWSKFIVPLFPEARYELFEPGVDAYERYGRGMQRRLKAHPNFHLHKTALGSAPGKITLHADEHFVGGTTLAIDPAIPGFTRYEVPVTTIDDVVARGQAPIPNLVKIDVQGGELDILKGAEQTLPHVEVLHLELWLTRGYGPKTPLLVEVALWLRERGFDLRDFADCYRNPEGVRCTQDCVFVNRRSPLSLVKD